MDNQAKDLKLEKKKKLSCGGFKHSIEQTWVTHCPRISKRSTKNNIYET